MFAVGMISVGFGAVDMAMVAPLGLDILAAVGLAEVVVVTVTAFLAGPIDAFSAKLSRAEGAGRTASDIGALASGFTVVVIGLQVVALGLALVSPSGLTLLGQEPELAELAANYIAVRMGESLSPLCSWLGWSRFECSACAVFRSSC